MRSIKCFRWRRRGYKTQRKTPGGSQGRDGGTESWNWKVSAVNVEDNRVELGQDMQAKVKKKKKAT